MRDTSTVSISPLAKSLWSAFWVVLPLHTPRSLVPTMDTHLSKNGRVSRDQRRPLRERSSPVLMQENDIHTLGPAEKRQQQKKSGRFSFPAHILTPRSQKYPKLMIFNRFGPGDCSGPIIVVTLKQGLINPNHTVAGRNCKDVQQ